VSTKTLSQRFECLKTFRGKQNLSTFEGSNPVA